MIRFASPSIICSIMAMVLTSMFAVPLRAQTASTRLEGIVWDPSGEPLSDVMLTAVEEITGRQEETLSDSEGYYRFIALQPGIYTVTAKAKGFKDVIHRNIALFSPSSTTENFSFEVSAIEKEVSPGDFPRLNDSASSGSFSRRDIEALPLIDRNPLSLSIYQPGVQINSGNEAESTVNGTRKFMNHIEMDGLSITNPVAPTMGSSLLTLAPDSIADLQIVTSGAKAEYGGVGGGQFVLASRSGSKSWSAEAYDYLRNRALNANEYFNNAQNIPRPGLARNIFGFSATGPVGNKTRLFANFEGNRTDQQLIRNRVVLTPTAKSGIFRWYTPDEITRDDTTVKSFDIAANDPRGLGIDPTIQSILEKLPEPNNYAVGDGLNTGGYRFDDPATFKQERVAARVDRMLNDNHQLFFRVNWEHTNATDISNGAEESFPGESSGTYVNNSWAVAAGSDWTINPHMINELRIGYIRPKVELERPARLSTPMLIANSWYNPLDPSFPRSVNFPAFEISDYVSDSMNRHALKYGISYRRIDQEGTNYSGVYPNVTFGLDHGNTPSSLIGPNEQSEISSTGRQIFEILYNDLLGRMESVSQTFNSKLTSTLPVGTPRIRDYGSNEFSAFFQDDWKIRRNLTLNLGLRYEVRMSPKERNGLQSVLSRVSSLSSSSEISDFSVAARDSWYNTDWKNIAPRIGFAWDITGSGSAVIRGGYGVYYDQLNGAITNFVDQNSYGFSQTLNLYPNLNGGDLRLSDGIPLPTPPGVPETTPVAARASSVAVLNPNLRTPRVDQFNLALEKRLWGLLLELGYSATRGKDLFQYTNLNQTKTRGDFLQAFQELKAYRDEGTPVPATNTLVQIFGTPMAALYSLQGSNFDSGQAGAAANELDLNYNDKYAAAGVSDFYIRNFPQFDRLYYGSNTSKSWFDSFQFGIRKTTNHFRFRTYYTWSKALDTVSSDGDTYVAPSDSFHPEIDKAPSDFSRTHVLNVAWDYALPFGRTRSIDSEVPRWVQAVFGGWNLGSLLVWESGQRFSVNSGRQSLFGDVFSLANLAEGTSRSIGRIYKFAGNVYWFAPDQVPLFTYPDAGKSGSSGRNSFVGPRYFNLDAVLQKRFSLSESRAVQFRVEAINVFNNTHFGLPDTNINSPIFGFITTTQGSPRALQVALRLQF